MNAANLAIIETNYVHAFVCRHDGDYDLRLSDIILDPLKKVIYELAVAFRTSNKRLRLDAALANTRAKVKQSDPR